MYLLWNQSVTFWGLLWPLLLSVLLCLSFRAWLLKGPFHGNPTPWPLLGMLPALLHNAHNVYDWSTHILIKNGGSFMFHGPWLSGMRYFVTAEPGNIQHALRSNSHNYVKGAEFSAITYDLLGDGIVKADGHPWQVQRKLVSLQLKSGLFRQHVDSTVFDMVEKRLIPMLRQFCDEKRHVDVQDLMLRFTFDAACMMVFGLDTNCFSSELPVVPFAEAIENAFDCCIFRFSLPPSWWRALRWLRLGRERGMQDALEVINKFCGDAISSKSRQMENEEAELFDNGQGDLLSCLLRMGGDTSHSNKLVKDLAINMLFAGRDTVGLALSWFFWLLAKHPDVEEKVFQEAQQLINTAKKEGRHMLSRSELSSMHYLHAALTESLRLYSSVPLNIRHVVSDDTLPDGSCVKRDDKFLFSIYTAGRMESIWGPDSMTFRPERWLNCIDGTFTHKWVSPFHYLAFSAGPRTCVGKDLAYLLMKSVASTLVYHFRVILIPGHKVVPKFSVTLYMKDGLLATLEARDRAPTDPQAVN
ncbi:hypothetical protein L7F22_062225 [Adiantum nelumboides]|nr:hypothetical protein [Adiantum nelumboides]